MRPFPIALVFLLCAAIARASTFPAPQPLSIGPRQGVPVSNDLLYISNAGNNSITVYHHDASGNTPPIAIIAGPRTGLDNPGQLSEDAWGNLYVTNSGNGNLGGSIDPNAGILIFAHGANGNVAPIRRLSGPNTGIAIPLAMTVDQITGKIFVLTELLLGNSPAAEVLRFPLSASGNVKPFATSSRVDPSREIVSDSTNKNIIEGTFTPLRTI